MLPTNRQTQKEGRAEPRTRSIDKQHKTKRDDDRQTHEDKPRQTTQTHQGLANDSETQNKDEKN